MKRTNILTIIFICSCLFTACKKDDPTTVSSPAYSTVDYNYTSVIGYTLSWSSPDRLSLFQWNAGNVNVNELLFNAEQQTGNVINNVQFGNRASQTVALFMPATLGAVPMPSINCTHASFGIGLASSASAPSLMLSGIYNLVPDMPPTPAQAGVPIQVIINDPITINTVWLDNIMIDKTNYLATITLDLTQLTSGITTDMMLSATRSAGTIMITSTANTNLYRIIVANLQSNIMQVQFQAQMVNAVKPLAQ